MRHSSQIFFGAVIFFRQDYYWFVKKLRPETTISIIALFKISALKFHSRRLSFASVYAKQNGNFSGMRLDISLGPRSPTGELDKLFVCTFTFLKRTEWNLVVRGIVYNHETLMNTSWIDVSLFSCCAPSFFWLKMANLSNYNELDEWQTADSKSFKCMAQERRYTTGK